MRYRVLGFVVWHGTKWLHRRRQRRERRRKLAIAAITLALAGCLAVVAWRRAGPAPGVPDRGAE